MLYIPEQAMSTAKSMVAPLARAIVIMGFPYSVVKVEGIPRALTIVYEVSELKFERVAPNPYMISEGGGIRNSRKATGNASCLSVWGLNKIRISPAINIGRTRMWYSKGVKV